MSGPTRTTLLAALAVLLTSSALAKVYDDGAWFLPVVGAVLVVAGAGLLSRRLQVPVALQPAVAAVLVAGYVGLLQARDTLALLVLPTPETVRRLGDRIGEGLLEVDGQAAPVESTAGLVLLAVLGVAAIAVAVDLTAAALRRPALAGLPLLALIAVPSGTLRGGVGWWPFALGAVGWLLLLWDDAGARVARWGTTVRPATSRGPFRQSSLGQVGRRIGAAALGVAVVVPALLPGLEARLLTGGTGTGLGGSRTTVTYNPLTRLSGQLRLPEPQPLLAYRSTDPEPDYLRLTTLDRFDPASGWSSSELSADVDDDAVSEGIAVSDDVRAAPSTSVTTAIRVLDLGGPWLPVPAVPTGVDIAGPWLWDAESETVFSTRVDLSDVDDVYRVTATRVLPDATALRRSNRVPRELERLAAPPQLAPYVQALTARVVEGLETPYDQVVALQALFRDPANGFIYSEDTDVPGVDSPDALERFLRGRRGFCQQYASAMAAMVRSLGIPVRVAVGFLPGTEQPDGTRLVTTNEGHAWPEVWFAGAGWVRFEPTPRIGLVRTPGYTVPPSEAEELAVPQPTESAAPTGPVPAATDPGAPDPRLLDDEQAAGGTAVRSSDAPRWISGSLLVLALLAAPAVLAAVRRRRRWRTPSAVTAWQQVEEDAVDVGHRWRPAESPLTAADALVAERPLRPEAAQALHEVAAAAEQERYARPGSTGGADAARLRSAVATVRSGLLATARPRARWTARLLPASALQWAATASGRGVADLLDRVDDLVSAATGAVGSRLRRS